MAWFADLSPCTYFTSVDQNVVLAVGWLEKGHTFPKGRPGDDVVGRLRELHSRVWSFSLYRGFHQCQFCRQRDAVSNSSIVVPGNGVIYASPTLLLHYIETHSYVPPEVFSDAVLRCPDPGTSEFKDVFLNNGGRELLFWMHSDESDLTLRSV